jgi:hypothetical protein
MSFRNKCSEKFVDEARPSVGVVTKRWDDHYSCCYLGESNRERVKSRMQEVSESRVKDLEHSHMSSTQSTTD